MATKRRILSALLASVAPDLGRLSCLDRTRERLGRGLLPAGGTADPKEAADLVLADASDIEGALRHVRADGLVLSFAPDGEDAHLLAPDAPVDVRGTVRTQEGVFRLCVPRPRVASEDPISLVVPTQDDLPALSRLVSVLAAESVHPPWELVVVDRGSEDGTSGFLRSIRGAFRAVHLARESSLEEAVTTGLSVARGSLAFVVAPGWLPAAGWRGKLVEIARRDERARAWIGALYDGKSGRALPARPGPLGTPTVYRLPLRHDGAVVVEPSLRVYMGRLARRPPAQDRPRRPRHTPETLSFSGLRAVPHPPEA